MRWAISACLIAGIATQANAWPTPTATSSPVCIGINYTMAILHSDGTWTINWSEVERVAALSPDAQSGDDGMIVKFARFLMNGRGKLQER